MSEPRTIIINGIRVAYLEQGSARPDAPSLVLLHGLIATSETYLPLMLLLGVDHHVIALDFPGSGLSQRLPGDAASIADMARWLTAVLDHFDLIDPVLIGHSHGGAVSLQLVIQNPKRVAGLVLISPAHPFSSHEDLLIRFYLTPPGRVFAYILPWLPRWVQLIGFRRMAGPASWSDPEQLEPYRKNLRSSGVVAHMLRLLGTWRADMQGLGRQLSPPIAVPTLMIWGDSDRAVPVQTAPELQQCFLNWRLIVLPKIGHRPAEEAPDQCASLIRTWLIQSVTSRTEIDTPVTIKG